jgi:hypothetical protein
MGLHLQAAVDVVGDEQCGQGCPQGGRVVKEGGDPSTVAVVCHNQQAGDLLGLYRSM